jgi:flagellar biosynthesis protein FliR
LSFLSIFSLYGLYLLWLGLPVLMKAPQDKSLLYAGAVVICAIVLGVILGFVQGALFAFPQIGAT